MTLDGTSVAAASVVAPPMPLFAKANKKGDCSSFQTMECEATHDARARELMSRALAALFSLGCATNQPGKTGGRTHYFHVDLHGPGSDAFRKLPIVRNRKGGAEWTLDHRRRR